MQIGLVGLGDMGAALAPRLAEAGHKLRGYDPARARSQDFATAGHAPVESCAALAGCEVIISLLPGAEALAATARDLAGLQTLWIEASTLSVTDKLAAQARFQGSMVDAPISGTAEQTRTGQATAFVSGLAADTERAVAVLTGPLARATVTGDFGTGTKVKLCANLLVPLHVACAAEAVLLACAQGLDPEVMLAAISGGPASSAMLELRGPLMVTKTYRPASGKLAIIAKDRRLVEGAAGDVPLPMLEAAFAFFDAAIGQDSEADLAYVIEAMSQAARAKSGGM